MEHLAALLSALPPASLLRGSAITYALLNATHILGIALLLGAILPLDLRIAGLLPGPPLRDLAPFLSRVAATGLVLVLLTGPLLLSVWPAEYLDNPAFRAKMLLILAALANLAAVHAGRGWRDLQRGTAPGAALRAAAVASALLWLGALLCGRLIGFQ